MTNQQLTVEKIRTRYIAKERSELDELRDLDTRVRRPANIFAYVFGSIAAIIMGAGMSLIMTDIGATLGIVSPFIPGLIIGIVGMLMALVNYPMFKAILAGRKNKYGKKIIALSDKIINN